MQNYTIEKTVYEKEISRDNCKGFKILTTTGLCKANKDDPDFPRDIKWYDENVLRPMIIEGKIYDGSKGEYDDRKMRYDGVDVLKGRLENILFVRLGHSHFLEYLEKKKRTKEETEKLVQMGIQFFKDKYAFFGRNPGVTGIVLTSDKKLVVGERQVGDKDRYEGLLQGVAGHLTYKADPKEINLEEEMLKETLEEVDIPKSKVSGLEFLGLFSDPSVAGDDLDFCYLIKTNLHSDYFKSEKWKENVKVPEHKEFLLIDDYNNLDNLVRTGNFNGKNWDIIFSTRGALASLKEEDFK